MSGTRMTEPGVTRNCLSPDLMIAYATAVTSTEKTRGSKLRIIGAGPGTVNSMPGSNGGGAAGNHNYCIAILIGGSRLIHMRHIIVRAASAAIIAIALAS